MDRIRPALILLASVAIQSILGSIYAWSVFVPQLVSEYHFTAAQAQAIFGLMVGMLTIAMTWAGRHIDQLGPRLLVLLAALFYGGGFILASLAGGAFWPTLLSLGVLGGAGMGCGYLVSLSTAVRWFPEHKGLVTGVSVMGFGGGALIVSQISDNLLTAGWNVLTIWHFMGTTAIIALGLLAFIFKPKPIPPTMDAEADTSHTFQRLDFWIAAGGIFCGTLAGLVLIGLLKPLALHGGLTSAQATQAVVLFALGNALGRVLWGWLMDRLGAGMIPLNLLLLAGLVALAPVASGAVYMFELLALLAGVAFGGCFVLYAVWVGQRFPTADYERVYPLVYLCYGLAAIIGPMTAGWLVDSTGGYMIPMLLAGSTALLGGLCWGATLGRGHWGLPRFRSA